MQVRASSPDGYAPRSPSPRLAESSRPISPRVTPGPGGIPERKRTPPPPSRPPPPPPPASASLPPRPSTPANIHSPRSLASRFSRQESEARASASEVPRQEANKSNGEVKPVRRPKRKPVHRTREEEQAAYGRVFVGCGQQGDYAVMTKLGEGTFG